MFPRLTTYKHLNPTIRIVIMNGNRFFYRKQFSVDMISLAYFV